MGAGKGRPFEWVVDRVHPLERVPGIAWVTPTSGCRVGSHPFDRVLGRVTPLSGYRSLSAPAHLNSDT